MLLSHYVSIYSFFWTHFPLFFFRFLLLINSIYLPFESSVSTFPNFCFLYFFCMLLELVIVEKLKHLENIVYTNTTNIGSRFRWIFVNLKTLISSNTIFEITLNFVIYFLFSESRKY